MQETDRFRVIIAGGGTGGHLFPGIAVAEELRDRHNVNVLFVSTDKKMTLAALGRYGLRVETIRAAGIKGRSILEALRALAMLPSALLRSLAILRDFRPQFILGVGGYVSGPVILGGRLMGRKTGIQEQNSAPGLTNRILGRMVDKVFISYPESERYFPKAKTILAGNPVRRELLEGRVKAREAQDDFGVLVLGGSQGAHRLNELMTAAFPELADIKERCFFVHQTGERDESWVRDAYRAAGFKATVSAFVTDMACAYARADLVVCRAGAGTLAELTALGKPSLLVPYPFAANNHQELNARSLEKSGAARVLIQAELTPAGLAAQIRSLFEDKDARRNMAARALERGRANAAALIAEECLKTIRKGS